MKKTLFFVLSLMMTFTIQAQKAFEDIKADRPLSANNYHAYPTPTTKLTDAPAGYEPFYISSYNRHGSRYLIDPNDYLFPKKTLSLADSLGMLTEKGKEVKDVVLKMSMMAENRLGELTPLGARQHRGIAERMYHNFPQVFEGNASVDARSTIIIRCILSMSNEILALRSLNPNLKVSMDGSEADMFYLNHSGKAFAPIYKDKEINKIREEFTNKHTHPERLMKELFKDDNYVKNNVNSKRLFQLLFDIACNMQSHDTDMELYSLFTDQECYDLWRCHNVSWFLSNGNSALTDGWMPYREAELLRDVLDKADKFMATDKHGADLRFGHESCLLPFVCLLELDDYGKEYNDMDALDQYWRSYEIFPMACNVQFIFYRKTGSDDVLVKCLLNEHEVRLPVSTNQAPYYHWTDVEKYYRAKLVKYDHSPYCK
ncbi:MAG: histidine-type phosphatase [Phocaeicola sp.]|uniref:histidine-type phosphatase n=1 Tax=Phocaeicola TaxID=909656 RepID=UPI00234FA0E5|nr:histidine-type phosphatase [Phocaeicola oris]MCE2616837.1 histidine acid phosphatase [Phocaeicola oris]